MRKRWFLAILFIFLPVLVFAEQPPLLNKITYQIAAEEWTQTGSAKVTVTIDASLDKVDLALASDRIMQKLRKIKDGVNWNITAFERSVDKSGLEQLHVVAETRISQSQLGDLRDHAKSISKPGETYQITAIDFSPSLAEIQQTYAQLRQQIYNQVKQEVARLNQTFPNQHYSLYSIEFAPAPIPMPIANKMYMSVGAMVAQTNETGVTSMRVSANIRENAVVVIASPTQVAKTKIQQ